MKKRVKDNFLKVRISTQELDDLKELADNYGFDGIADLVRYGMAYIKKNRPILGKGFAPGTIKA